MHFDEYAQSFQDGYFDNPLRDCPENEFDSIITTFCNRTPEFQDISMRKLIRRGALLVQDPNNLRRSESDHQFSVAASSDDENRLTNQEQMALDREGDGQLSSLTKDLIVILVVCAIGAITHQESIVGANLAWPIDLGLAYSENGMLRYHEPRSVNLAYFGLVNAIPYFAASIAGVWIIDPISAFYGRRGALLFAAICSFVAPIGASSCREWYQLFGFRLVQGVGMGAKASVVPVFESEVCPPRLRGRLLVLWQTFVASGILLGAATNRYFIDQWRQQIAYAFLPAVPLMCLCYMIPESPRWLIKKCKYFEAYQVLIKLRETPLQAARDLIQIYAQVKLEPKLYSSNVPNGPGITIAHILQTSMVEEDDHPTQRLDFFRRLRGLFTIKRNQRAVIGSCTVMIAQQFCGINVFALLSTTVFGNTTVNKSLNLWINFTFASSNAVFSAAAFFMVDRLGRRTLLLASLVAMMILLPITGHLLDKAQDEAVDKAQHGAVMILICIFAMVYSPGAGVVPFMYSSEVFGQMHREIGMSFAVAVNMALAGALAITVPQYDSSSKGSHMMLLSAFAGSDGLAAVLVYFFMRTPGVVASLEDMNFLFGASTFSYITYQIRYVAPLTIRNLQPFRKSEIKMPFGDSDWKKEILREEPTARTESPSVELDDQSKGIES